MVHYYFTLAPAALTSQGNVLDLDFTGVPLAEQLDAAGLWSRDGCCAGGNADELCRHAC